MRMGRGRARQRIEASDEIRGAVIHHVLVHGMAMKEAGQSSILLNVTYCCAAARRCM